MGVLTYPFRAWLDEAFEVRSTEPTQLSKEPARTRASPKTPRPSKGPARPRASRKTTRLSKEPARPHIGRKPLSSWKSLPSLCRPVSRSALGRACQASCRPAAARRSKEPIGLRTGRKTLSFWKSLPGFAPGESYVALEREPAGLCAGRKLLSSWKSLRRLRRRRGRRHGAAISGRRGCRVERRCLRGTSCRGRCSSTRRRLRSR